MSETAGYQLAPEELFPDPVVPEAGSRMGLLWWALRGRVGGCAALEAQAQLRLHADGLYAAVRQADQLTQTRLRAALDATCLFTSILPVGVQIQAVMNLVAALKDTSDMENGIHRAFETREGLIDRGRRANEGRELTLRTRAAAIPAAQNNGRQLAVVAGIMPLAIVVDEAEFLDDVTIDMLKVILRRSGTRGMIVVAVNTDSPHADDSSDSSSVNLYRWLDEEKEAGRLHTISLTPLADDELVELAAHHLDPEESGLVNEPNLASVISASHGRPGRLVFLLNVPAIREAVSGAGRLPADLESFTPASQAQQLFELLPPGTRRVLATAGMCGPKVPAEWLTTAPQGTLDGPVPLNASDMAAAQASGWAEISQDGVFRFISDVAHKIALGRVPIDLTPDRQQNILASMAGHVRAAQTQDVWTAMAPDVCESILAALTGETAIRTGIEPEPAWTAELIRIRQITGRAASDEAALSRLEKRLRTGVPSGVLITATAEALFDAGHVQRAFDLLQDELDRLITKYGEGAPATFPALGNLAAAWAALARDRWGQPDAPHLFDTAIDLYRKVLHGQVAYRPAGHAKIIKARDALAGVLAEAYKYVDAIHEGQQCIKEMEAHQDYGPDHPGTLATRHNHAHWTGEAGNPAAARDLFAALLSDRERIFGPDHLDTLATRPNHAHWTGEAGNPEAARDLFAALLPDLEMVLGPDHPATLTTRNNHAHWTGRAGNPAAARDLFAALLPDRERVLGPDHPDTLTTRNNHAIWTGRAGNPAAARDLFAALLPDRERVLGPDHPGTLTTRHNLATWTGHAGNPEAARDLFAALLPDKERVLGPDHPDTLTTRHSYARWTGRAGNPEAARDLFAALLPDRERVLGPDHPDTLITRNNHAHWTGEAGNPEAARDLFAAMLPDLERVLGPDHPDTLATRGDIDFWNETAGG